MEDVVKYSREVVAKIKTHKSSSILELRAIF